VGAQSEITANSYSTVEITSDSDEKMRLLTIRLLQTFFIPNVLSSASLYTHVAIMPLSRDKTKKQTCFLHLVGKAGNRRGEVIFPSTMVLKKSKQNNLYIQSLQNLIEDGAKDVHSEKKAGRAI